MSTSTKYEVAYSDGYGHDGLIYVEANSIDEIYDWFGEEPDFYIQTIETLASLQIRVKMLERGEIEVNIPEERKKLDDGN